MIELTIKGNECGAKRGEGNHWLELRWLRDAPYFLGWSPDSLQPGTEHICGEKCAHAILSKHLTALRDKTKKPSE